MTSANEIPLAVRANAAWTGAFLARRGKITNWSKLLDEKRILDGLSDDPNPHIRKLADDFNNRAPDNGRAA